MSIVAAVDQSERAKRVIAEAVQIADAFDTDLHVLHVAKVSTGNLVSGTTEEGPDVEEAKAEAQATAEEIATDAAPDHPVEAVGAVGDPAAEIIAFSEEVDADYIVLSGRKKSPTGKALFGSVTQSVLLDADRPVVSTMG